MTKPKKPAKASPPPAPEGLPPTRKEFEEMSREMRDLFRQIQAGEGTKEVRERLTRLEDRVAKFLERAGNPSAPASGEEKGADDSILDFFDD